MSKIRKNHHLIPAFTMIELILVIVILGVVASIGSDILKSLYEYANSQYYGFDKTNYEKIISEFLYHKEREQEKTEEMEQE